MQSLEALLFVWHRRYAGPFTNAETQPMARVVVEPTQTQKKSYEKCKYWLQVPLKNGTDLMKRF